MIFGKILASILLVKWPILFICVGLEAGERKQSNYRRDTQLTERSPGVDTALHAPWHWNQSHVLYTVDLWSPGRHAVFTGRRAANYWYFEALWSISADLMPKHYQHACLSTGLESSWQHFREKHRSWLLWLERFNRMKQEIKQKRKRTPALRWNPGLAAHCRILSGKQNL